MRFLVGWTLAIGVTIILACHFSSSVTAAGNNGVEANREPKPLDLKTPFQKIGEKFANFNKRFNIMNIMDFVMYLLPCLSQNNDALNELHVEKKFQVVANYVTEHQEEIESAINAFGFDEICKTPYFKIVHNFMWVDDEQKSLHALVKFFWRFGFPNAYEAIKTLYTTNDCPAELIASLPDGPTDSRSSGRASQSFENNEPIYNIEQDLVHQIIANWTSYGKNPFKLDEDEEGECSIVKILTKFLNTGILDLVMLIQTTVHEVVQRPSLHFLLGQIQEPQKGKSFRKFRVIEENRQYIWGLDQCLKYFLECADPDLQILSMIEEKFGINLKDMNILELVLQLFEVVFWTNLAPVIPPPPISRLDCSINMDNCPLF